jgi:succinyl-diaminopimelate desuccinylase
MQASPAKLKILSPAFICFHARLILVLNKTVRAFNLRPKAYTRRFFVQVLIYTNCLKNTINRFVMKRVFDFIEGKDKEMVELTSSLVKINSVNSNETEVAELIKDRLNEYGVKSRLIGKDKSRRSIIAEVEGDGKASIMLNGHLDTVPFGDVGKWKHDPLSGRVVDGKLFGRGSCDMKSGVVALMYAGLAMQQADLNGKIIMVFDSDEEAGSQTGIRDVLDSGVRADACIVGEPMSKNKLVIGSRGIYRFRITTKGQTAHTGSTRTMGINAVSKMAKIITQLESIKPRYEKHELCPPPRITTSVVKGGTAINIIPDKCEALVDCRLSIGQTRKTITEDIETAIEQFNDKKLLYEIEEMDYSTGYVTDKNERIVQLGVEKLKQVMNIDSELIVSGPTTDGNIIATKGIPIITLGPTGDNCHSENEYVNTRSIPDIAKVHASIINGFFG